MDFPNPQRLPRRDKRSRPSGNHSDGLPCAEERGLQQPHEFLRAEAAVPDDCPESASIQFLMIRNHDLGEGIAPTQDDVASFLSLEVETYPLKGLDALTA